MFVAYVVTVAAGLSTVLWVDLEPLWNGLLADLIATVVIFGFSVYYRNSSLYDAYWSVIPPLLAVYWMLTEPASLTDPRAWMLTLLVWFWGIRLTANWTLHWGGMSHEDWRYPLVRQRAGKAALPADFLGIHLFPTVQVFLGCVPIYFVTRSSEVALGWLDALAFGVCLGAVLIETIADLQLHAFIKRRQPGQIMDRGLWAWSRHPNYFGELSFWWGLMLFGLAASPSNWMWILPGALSMTAMFVFVSVPFLDQRSLERRPGYADYCRRVSALVPMPPKA